MKNQLFLSIILSLSFVISANAQCIETNRGLYCANINSANFNTEWPTIRDYIDTLFYGLPPANDAIENVANRLNALFLFDDFKQDCSPGYIYKTAIEKTGTQSIVDLRWTNELEDVDYFHGLMRLSTGELLEDDKTDGFPGASYTVDGSTRLILYTLNARCENGQSGYYIIIIDRDLDFNEIPGGIEFQRSSNEEDQNQSLTDTQNSELKLIPNPIANTNAKVEFTLAEESISSLNLIEASTGKLVQSILSKQLLSAGKQTHIINTEGLAPGLYYVVLQTEKTRKVSKLVKVKL